MAIELSGITFTDQGDIVPVSGIEEILNTGITNTLAGDDIITGTGVNNYARGILNEFGIIYTSDGNDIIIGIHNKKEESFSGKGIFNAGGTIDTGNGDDIIIGMVTGDFVIGNESYGIQHEQGTIDTGDGNDRITGITQDESAEGIYCGYSIIDTGKGNDIITGSGFTGINLFISTVTTGDGNDTITGICSDFIYGAGIASSGLIDTGDGDDIIAGISNNGTGVYNRNILNTGKGKDSIISQGKFINSAALFLPSGSGGVFLGDGNDSINITDTDLFSHALENFNIIDTGDGKDIITSTGVIYNQGVINAGNGEDSLIADGGYEGSGNVFLEKGKDYLKGFGTGNFNGGNGKDILELTSGSYTIGISGTTVNFTKNSIIMNTSEFEQLIAGGTTYNFSSFTNGQVIFVA